ncbi:flagellar basal body rod protein [Burkholderia thailandensis]|uniref:flagellar basal body rod protein n=1 Tax=Burkholderia thailandensis TaxID=57975 RepID=UPI002D79DD88|nr:flagellar basal body rod protein [Burkholderia thailandensis]WRS69622.1 flagellar basal body rod protein [Burkholderia thailandensis]
MKKKTVVSMIVGATLLGGGAAGGTWALLSRKASHPPAPVAAQDKYKYVGESQIVVMLRQPDAQNPMPSYSEAHYAMLDLVLKTTPEKEAIVHDHMLLLRSLTVDAVSQYTLDQIRRMNVTELANVLDRAFRQSYKTRAVAMPFESVMIGKLLAE